MEKKQIGIDQPVRASTLTIIPVIQTAVYAWPEGTPVAYLGTKKPLYVLIRDQTNPIQAFTMEGQSITLDQIQAEYPELKDKLDSFKY